MMRSSIASRQCVHRLEAHDPVWAPLFEQIPEPPSHLWVKGESAALEFLLNLPERGLGVVGTREPSPRTLAQIDDWIAPLKGSGLVVVSGFARGVDAQAHRSALRSGVPTVAVLACGVEVDYPPQNRALGVEILNAQGLWVSELEPEARPKPWDFLRRNRIIAAWSQALWVAEAPFKSGALNTATWARDLHKTCFATPCQPGDPAFAGNQDLLDRHHALPFWGPHSLGAVWLELAGLGLKRTACRSAKAGVLRNEGSTDSGSVMTSLIERIRQSTYRHGGESVSGALDWAVEQGLSPPDFFELLRLVLERGLCREENGVLFGI